MNRNQYYNQTRTRQANRQQAANRYAPVPQQNMQAQYSQRFQHPTMQQAGYNQPMNNQPVNQAVYNQVPQQYRQMPQRAFKPSHPNNMMSQRPMDLDVKDLSREQQFEYMFPKDLTVKFADDYLQVDSPRVSKMHAGWLEPTTDDFFTRVVDEPIMLKEGRVQKMTAMAHDIDQFDVDPVFDLDRDENRVSKGLTTEETTPEFKRKQLLAKNMNYMTYIQKNFLLGNIKEEGFHQWFYGIMGDKAGNAWMSTGLYARTDQDPVLIDGKRGTAFHGLDGVLKQVYDISQNANEKGKGFATMGYADNVSDAIDKAILDYSDQQGGAKKAKLILPSNIKMRLAIEVKNNRDSDFASAVYLKGPGEVSTIYGKPLLENEELEKVRNGWANSLYFKDGEVVPEGTTGAEKGTNVVYGYYGDPENIVWGMLKEAELETSYQHPKRSYLVSVALAGDVKINYSEDTIVIPFDLGKKEPVAAK